MGIVTFHFSIPNLQNKFMVPFIVTSNNIANPIIGFNTIEHLVKESSSDSFNLFSNIFPNMKENKTELNTNLIQENSKISDVIGTIKKSAESIRITPNSFSFVKCVVICPNTCAPLIFLHPSCGVYLVKVYLNMQKTMLIASIVYGLYEKPSNV